MISSKLLKKYLNGCTFRQVQAFLTTTNIHIQQQFDTCDHVRTTINSINWQSLCALAKVLCQYLGWQMLVTMFSTLWRFFSAPSSETLPLLSSIDDVLLSAGLIGDICISSILVLRQTLKSSARSSTDVTDWKKT